MLDDGSIAATRDRWTTSIRRSRTERTGAAEAAVLSRWIVVVLACLGYSRSELRVGHTKKIGRGDVVAIIGGSFSGLMLAVSIAVADGAIVYIFEKEKRLLHRFLDKGHRHLSPNLNLRYLGKRFDRAPGQGQDDQGDRSGPAG